MDTPSITSMSRLNKIFDYPGYIISKEALERLNSQIIKFLSENSDLPIAFIINIRTSEGKQLQFTSFDSFKEFMENGQTIAKDIEVRYTQSSKYGLSIDFRRCGIIEIDGFGEDPTFQFKLHLLEKEIETFKQDYSWPVRQLFFSSKIRKLFMMIIIFSSFSLLFNIFYFFYGNTVGVNIDPNYLIRGNEYFKEVVDAIKSDSLNLKFDVLLKGQLRHFDNISNIKIRTQNFLKYSLIVLVISSIILLILQAIKKLYPVSFISIGTNAKKLIKMEKQREIWIVGIVIAFIINLISGIIIVFIT